MKKLKAFMMLAAIAAASFTFTSCDDDDPWREPDFWNNWGWRDDDSYQDSRISEANMLVGDWMGTVKLQEQNEDGSTSLYEFNANMIFYQDRQNAITGSGVEIDQTTDENGSPVSQTLKFTWSIADNNNIYITYNGSGSTYLLDANASEDGYGFHLGQEKGYQNDTFYGYMIGTGSVKGDLMYIDLERNTSSSARVKSRNIGSTSTAATQTFGKTSSRKSLVGEVTKGLPKRR